MPIALREDCPEVLKRIYHDYGLKHVCLISILIIYQFIGAGVFYFCEAGFDESKEKIWNIRIAENRTKFVFDIIPLMFNNTDYLFFLTQEQTDEVSAKLHAEVRRYEKQLGIRYTDQKIKWDFWNACFMLRVTDDSMYCIAALSIFNYLRHSFQTICTTIGYGHLYPSTVSGRVFTMIYAIFGIPLVLSILDDLGNTANSMFENTMSVVIKCRLSTDVSDCTKKRWTEYQNGANVEEVVRMQAVELEAD
ncbi:Ion channel, partial [Ostertagia ostertagi]